MVDVSIIIVNWNSTDYLRACVDSIYGNASDLTLEVIVVDNGSSDNSLASLLEQYPAIISCKLPENVGFSKANNAGYRVSQGKTLLFLNPDTKIVGNAIQEMSECLWSIPEAGLVGCKLLNDDLSIQTSSIQRFPTILNQALDIDILKRASERAKLWGMYPLFQTMSTPTEVEVISGACLMIRRDAFVGAGLFSTDYFMYAEDVDLCFEIRRIGRKSYYVPSATVIHYGGGSSGKRQGGKWAAIMQRKSLLHFCIKTHGRYYGRLYRVTVALAASIRIALLGVAYLISFPTQIRHEVGGSCVKWCAILRWSLCNSASPEVE